MSSQKVIVYLTSLVAIGIVVVGLLATVLHSTMLAPIPVLGLILAVLVLLTNKGHFAHTVENIEKANRLAEGGLRIDTLIVGRGGGSPEDLAAFNDESVCRTIFSSKIPIISAVGHESDFSISDMVADVRAETPTAAADMAVMNTFELRESIDYFKEQLLINARTKIESERQLLNSRTDLLLANIKSKINDVASMVDKAVIVLRENDPRSIFSKGYAAVTDSEGVIIPGIASVKKGKQYIIRMKDGSFSATANEINSEAE